MDTTPGKRWLETYPNLKRALVGVAIILVGRLLTDFIPRVISLPDAGEAGLLAAGLLFRVIGLVVFWGAVVLAIVARLTRGSKPPAKAPDGP